MVAVVEETTHRRRPARVAATAICQVAFVVGDPARFGYEAHAHQALGETPFPAAVAPMADLTLCLGTKNLSSWSLRAWMALAHTGVRFDEVVIPLHQPDTKQRILAYSPSGKVPVLRHGETIIWESLAICDYVHELFPDAQLWPENREARAVARSVSEEMHAGFLDLRKEMPMEILARHGKRTLSAAATRDLERVLTLWRTCRARYGQEGPFLFSTFSIADCMFAPMVTRFVTYDVAVDTPTRQYMDSMLATPEMVRWTAEAKADLEAAAHGG